jgi:guanylate kinase
MIILVGESASGKSTIEKILSEKYGYVKTVSYTTRPPRDNEVDGIDYNFISTNEYTEKFNNNFFVEIGAYNGWFYGTTAEQYRDNTVCVLTPHGLRQIKKKLNKDLNITTFYINVPRRDRLIKILQRGDNIDEAIRRNQSDVGQYDGIEDEVDYVLENKEYRYTPEEMVERVVKILNEQKA